MKGPKLLKRVAVFALALVMVLGIVPVMPIEVRAAKPEDIPDAMWNSSILNAWEYLGAGEYTPVAKLKENDLLFRATKPEVLYDYHAGIIYPVGGGGSNYGMSTIDDLSTYTGKAPKVTGYKSFRSLGFVCASFSTYYILNYKYNIEGLDCPDFRNAMFYYTKDPEVDENGEPILSTGLGYNYHAVKTWYHCLADMTDSQYFLDFVPESQNVKRIYEHEFENPAPIPKETIAKMQPGDVLIYGRYGLDDKGDYKKFYSHVSIYAGSYGGYDFIVHCPGPGGNYGPTMGTLVADFDQEGGKESAHVVAVYHLNYVPLHETSITVKKQNEAGEPLAGAVFTATHTNGTAYDFPATGTDGTAKLSNIPFGTYIIKEIKAPDGYELSTKTQTVTIGAPKSVIDTTPEDKLDDIYHVTTDPFVDKSKPQTLQIIKTTDTGMDLSGWQFEVRDSENNLVGTYTATADDAKKQGVVCVEGLEPGEYTVKEIIPAGSNYETEEDTKTVTVSVGGENAVTFHNTIKRGSIEIKKTDSENQPLAGAVFTATHDQFGEVYTFPETNEQGFAKLENLPYGTYTVKEIKAPAGYVLPDTTWTVTVGEGAGESVNSVLPVTNDQIKQSLQIIKTTDTDTDFAGWQFEVRDSENNLVGTYTTRADGTKKQGVVYVEDLKLGEYTVKEIIPAGSDYETEEDTKTVTVSVGGENSVTFHNTIKRGSIEIEKTDPKGQPLAGAVFTATHDQFGEVYTFPETDEQGFAKLEDLPYGTYTVEEIKAPAGYVLPDTTWTVTVGEGAGESVNSVLPVTNDPINQTLQIIKTTDTDTDFAGWQFEVRDSENNLVGTYTTTADGTKKQGVVYVEGLEPGEYTVKEIIPAGSDYETEEDTKTVTVAFGGTNSVTFHNTIKHCSIVVQKVTDSGKELEGWEIELYRDSVAPANLVDTKTTDEEGKVEFADLMPGKYIVHEKTEREFWVNKTGDITVELQPGGSTTVNMENELRGDLKIVKEVSDGDASIDGWQFKITNVTDEDNPVELGIFTTQNGGVILKEDIAPGVYLVEEIIPEGSEYKCVGDNPKTVEVKAGQVNSVTFKNEVKRGSITVHKITNTENEEDKYGWTIELYRNSVADGNLVATIITSAENGGMVVFDDLLPGTYVVHESTEKDFWVNATGDITVELAADEKADVTIQNNSLGDLKILKKILDGDASVEGWQFKVTDITDPENPVEIGTFTTDKDGVILKEDLEEGTYLVEEIIPEGSDYICNCENPQTVTIVKGDTTKVTFENRVLRGSITVQKSVNSNDPEALKGWEVELYLVEGDTETLKDTKTTDQNGQVLFSNLLPGTYIVREKTQKDFWLDETGDVTVVLKPKVNETEEVTLKNSVYGDLEIVKKVLDGDASVEGWQFKVTNITDPENPVEIGTFTTDKDGVILKEDLEEGTYLVEEIIPDDSEYVCIGENPREIEVKAEQVNEVIFENELEKGEAKIIKITNTGENLEGWKFNIYTDKEKTNLVEGSPFTTDEEGLIVERLLPGTYYIQEVDESATKPGWIFDTELKEVTIAAFETEEVRFENTQQGEVKIVKTILNGEASAEGWTFRITNITDAENPVEIGEFTTDAEGIICKYLLPGTYKVEELTTKDPLYYSKAENPVTVEIKAGETETVSFQNAMKLGEFEIIKVDTYGNPLEGAIFLVEWSEDGETWAPVTSCTIENAVKGGCTSPDLKDGKLVTGKDGIAKFTGLWPELQYRVTEAQAPPGYWMQKKIVFNDKLTLDDLDLSWKVVNKKMTITPEDPDNPGTGDINLPALMGVSALSLVCILGLAILPGMKRSKKRVR